MEKSKEEDLNNAKEFFTESFLERNFLFGFPSGAVVIIRILGYY